MSQGTSTAPASAQLPWGWGADQEAALGLPPQPLHRLADGCGVTGVIMVLGQVDVCVRYIERAGISGFNELPGDLRKDHGHWDHRYPWQPLCLGPTQSP